MSTRPTLPPGSSLQTDLLEQAINAATNGIVIADYTQPNNPVLYVNHGFERLTGYSAAEVLGRNCRFLQGNDQHQAALVELGKAIKQGCATTQVLRNYRKDGTLFYNELHLSPVYNAEGQLVNFIGVQTDVTARVVAEEQLRQSEQRFKALIEHSAEMITMTSRQGEVLYQSPSVARLMGYTEEELTGRNSFELVHPDDVTGLIAQQRKLGTQPGLMHHNEFRFRHKDGTWHYVETVAQNLLDQPGIEAIVVNGHDVTARKQVELALRQSEEMLNFALSAAKVGIWEYNVTTDRVRWSKQVAPLAGFAFGSLAQTFESTMAMAVPEDQLRLKQVVLKALQEGGEYHIEYRVVRPDGQLQWLEGKGRAYLDDAGQPLRMSGTVQDITARKQTEAALIESEARFAAFMEHSPAAAFILDYAANFVYVNKAYQQIFELPENLIGRNCAEFFPPEISARHYHYDQIVLENQQVLVEAESWKRRDGSAGHWFGYKFPMHDANGRKLVGGVGLDVTTAKQAEEALRLSEARLSGIINSATDAIITLDNHERIVVFNTAAEKMFGYKAEQVKGETIERFLLQRYRTTHSRHIANFSMTGATGRTMGGALSSLTALRRGGEEFPIEATISQVNTDGQKFYTVIIRDISERQKVAEALARSEAQLAQAQKMEAVGQLAGGVAHDFNNLLTVITGYSELILASLNKHDPLYSDVAEIKWAADRAAGLTRQLLAFSRKQVLQPSVLNLNEVVSEMHRMLRRLIGENIELITLADENLAQVKADRGQLEQVIVNLAVNAGDAMPGGGKLIFETSNVELSEEYTRYHPEVVAGQYVRLAVSDSGVGMNETVRTRLFEPFFTTKERGRGTGLGLSTVFGIVKQSGGQIEVYSEEGHGTTFKIYLPVVRELVVQGEESVNKGVILPPASPRHHETVLLVEDEEELRHLAVRILEQYGYKVIQAGHGGEALLLGERYQGQLDILVTDVVMPELGGLELSRRLAPLQPQMKVLYMSGYSDQLVLEQNMLGHETALQNFIHKPFTPQVLAQKVRAILDN